MVCLTTRHHAPKTTKYLSETLLLMAVNSLVLLSFFEIALVTLTFSSDV